MSRSVAEETAEIRNIVVVYSGSRSTGTESLNPYHSSSYNYSFNSRHISLGLTWRIGRMELIGKSLAKQGDEAALKEAFFSKVIETWDKIT